MVSNRRSGNLEIHSEGSIRPNPSRLARLHRRGTSPGRAAPARVGSEAARPVQPMWAAWFVQPFANVGTTEVSWGVGVFALVVTVAAWRLATRHSADRRTLVNVMTLFGERFIREFERPLRLPGSDARALESRLRFIPRQGRLDILLAPHDGIRIPTCPITGRTWNTTSGASCSG